MEVSMPLGERKDANISGTFYNKNVVSAEREPG